MLFMGVTSCSNNRSKLLNFSKLAFFASNNFEILMENGDFAP